MANHIIRSNFLEGFQIDRAGQQWIFTKGSLVTSEGEGILTVVDAPNTTVTINGTVTAGVNAAGVFVQGDRFDVTVGKSGLVTGEIGVVVLGNDVSIHNRGRIICPQETAMFVADGIGAELRNDGFISAATGMISFNDEATIVNGKSGTLVVEGTGINIASGEGSQTRVVNHGSILSDTFAVDGSRGDDTVINDGIMQGTVRLGEGNDRFDNRNGKLDGSVIGGAGDDTIIVDDGDIKLVEEADEGNDVVKTTVAYTLPDNVEELFLLGRADKTVTGNEGDNRIHGNRGDNLVEGAGGNDHVFGHKGDDELLGGLGADVFHFATRDGRDGLFDYVDGTDHIDLSRWNAIEGFEDLTDNHLRVKGDDLVIKSGGDELVIRNMALADLDSSDFVF
jgi:Ca2+-binding RTX toxin-like protein